MVDKYTTRKASMLQEKRIAKAIGARCTSNSGATKFDKGDIVLGSDWIIEAKTCMTPKKSFSIKQEWLEKLKGEMYATGKDYNALCFDFGSKDKYYIIEENLFIQLKDLLKN